MYEYNVQFTMDGSTRTTIVEADDEYNAIAAAAIRTAVDLMMAAAVRGESPLETILATAEMFANGSITIEI